MLKNSRSRSSLLSQKHSRISHRGSLMWMSFVVANLAVGCYGGIVVWVGASLMSLFGVWDLGFGLLRHRRWNGFELWVLGFSDGKMGLADGMLKCVFVDWFLLCWDVWIQWVLGMLLWVEFVYCYCIWVFDMLNLWIVVVVIGFLVCWICELLLLWLGFW